MMELILIKSTLLMVCFFLKMLQDLRIDNLGNKWVGTGGGISILDNQNLISQNYTRMYICIPPPDTLNPVVEIDIGSNGNVWVAIYVGYLAEGGVAYFDGVDYKIFDISDGLIGPNIRGIAIDIYNNTWVQQVLVSKKSLPISSTNNLFINPCYIFPNPSTGEYFFSSSVEISDISLYNSFGMKILSIKSNASKINFKEI